MLSLKKHYLIQGLNFNLCFLLRVLILAPTFRYLINFEFVFLYGIVRGPISLFAYGHSIVYSSIFASKIPRGEEPGG